MTSTLIYDQASGHWGNSQKMIYYAWTDIPGLQKFGSYQGYDDADGPFIELGFRPAIIIFKNITDNSTEGGKLGYHTSSHVIRFGVFFFLFLIL